jgi:hypothetical protein
MRGAVRPFVPGPLVIVDETMKERKIVGLGIERGPLTEREKRQFMPPRNRPKGVRRRRHQYATKPGPVRKFVRHGVEYTLDGFGVIRRAKSCRRHERKALEISPRQQRKMWRLARAAGDTTSETRKLAA